MFSMQESPGNQSRPPRPLSMTQYQPSSCSSPVSSPLATPTLPSPISSPASTSASPLSSPRTLNGYHRPAPAPPKAASNSKKNDCEELFFFACIV